MIHPLANLLDPQSLAVFGPVTQPGSQAYEWWHLLQHGSIPVVGVTQQDGVRHPAIVSDLSQAPSRPDVAIIADDDAKSALIACDYAGVPVAVYTGKSRQDLPESSQQTILLRSGQFGFMRPSRQLSVSCLPMLTAGPVAVVSQSGLVAGQMAHYLQSHNLGCSFMMVIKPNDEALLRQLLWLLEHDAETAVIGVYVEHLPEDRTLIDMLQRICRHKPLVILYGRGQASALTSTLYAQSGAVMADSLRLFEHLLTALSTTTALDTTHPIDPVEPYWRYAAARQTLQAADGTEKQGQAEGDQSQRPSTAEALDRLQQSWPHLKQKSAPTSDLPISIKQGLRQTGRVSADRLQFNPSALTWLSQAGIAVRVGQPVQSGQSLDWQVKQVGWPLQVTGSLPVGRQLVSHRLRSLSSVRQFIRAAKRQGAEDLWLQSQAANGWDVQARFYRHPTLGPLVSAHLPAVITESELVSVLPLSSSTIESFLGADAIPDYIQSSDRQALQTILQQLSQLMLNLPELAELQTTILTIDGHAAVQKANITMMT